MKKEKKRREICKTKKKEEKNCFRYDTSINKFTTSKSKVKQKQRRKTKKQDETKRKNKNGIYSCFYFINFFRSFLFSCSRNKTKISRILKEKLDETNKCESACSKIAAFTVFFTRFSYCFLCFWCRRTELFGLWLFSWLLILICTCFHTHTNEK